MKRGTKEFYDIQESFEKAVNSGALGYIPSDFEEHNSGNHTFYANGAVDSAFKCFLHGYSAGRCEYIN